MRAFENRIALRQNMLAENLLIVYASGNQFLENGIKNITFHQWLFSIRQDWECAFTIRSRDSKSLRDL
jgi:hypothetical protein